MERKPLRSGFTTGSCAVASALAGVHYHYFKTIPSTVTITLPSGETLPINITTKDCKIGVLKDSGDDPDVTNGIFIYTDLSFNTSGTVTVDGGVGVGTVTRKGLSVDVGCAAINPTPRKMMIDNLLAALPMGAGVDVVIHIPDGVEIAKKTFNERLGIVGGISVLGTSGIVSPMSADALVKSIYCEIDVLTAEGVTFIWLTPGRIGELALKRVEPDIRSVQMSNFAGDTLTYLRQKGFKEVGLAGHPGKLAKLAMGAKNTHSAQSPQANEYIQTLFQLDTPINTVEEICTDDHKHLFPLLCEEIAKRVCADYGFDKVYVKLFNMAGEMLIVLR